jgi:serine/threonine-protein kinase
VKVADFGLARSAAAGATVSLAGMIVGTASYLAPEQVKSGVCDARSDVYSAGIVLYELLTGEKPFVADSPIQVAYRHVHDQVPPPSSLVHGLDPALDALVARATAKLPDTRPADANVLHAEVIRIIGSLPDAALDFGAIPERSDPDNTATAEFADMSGQRHFARTRMMPAPETTRAVPQPPPLPSNPTRVDPVAQATRPGGRQVFKPRTSPNQPRQLVPADQPWRPRRGHYALAVIVVIALVLGIVTWWVTSGQFRAMPSVLRQTQDAAVAELTRDGLHPEVLTGYSDSVPSGQVITSSPDPSGKVKKGGSVKITVSLGQKPVAVPDQTGQSSDAATQVLRAAGFQVVIAPDQVFSETVNSGSVASVNPQFAQPGATVTLTLSKGAQTFPVPKVTGLSEEQAKATLAAAGFDNVQVNKWFFGDTVYSQQPAAGTSARHRDPVAIYENPLS